MPALSALESDLAPQIETLIDRYGLSTFLSILGYVCGEKSEHLATNWQDATAAKTWLQLSAEIDKLTARAEEFGL